VESKGTRNGGGMAEKKRILIIDDEMDFVAIVKERLEFEGYEVVFAKDGQVGMELMREMHMDAVLLDIIMPEMNGFEVLDKMKGGDEVTVKPPIIIVTAYSHQIPKDGKHDLSEVAFTLHKPFDMGKLLDLLHKVLPVNS
jgi:two-component system, OmpR family, alkaline phosphatase synthesis response regulator PhoP